MGAATARPSGMLCMAMAKAIAGPKLGSAIVEMKVAMPSGKLCNATAIPENVAICNMCNRSDLLRGFSEAMSCTAGSGASVTTTSPTCLWKHFMPINSTSMARRIPAKVVNVPHKKPLRSVRPESWKLCFVMSKISEKDTYAMTPADTPRQTANTRLSSVLAQNAMAAPIVVARPASRVRSIAKPGSPSEMSTPSMSWECPAWSIRPS
mmetsp:Transcript_139558/g.197595  ORF Transcript_139558/g.197595 Transcript_139558/m.197595 type:complete len:208 (+) Transcript_139558:351-974(+)